MTVTSANEHQPQSSQSEYPLSVEENEAGGALIGVVSASDGDHDVLTYSVQQEYSGTGVLMERKV